MSEIFCRPGCSTRTPRPTYVTFYPTAAAAHAAGLTPCPRCQPDGACVRPEIFSDDSLSARAVRLVLDGLVDRGGVDAVADHLNITSRHLLRAVNDLAGCGPLALARTRRAHIARLLLTGTTITIGEVAAASGFTTVRQFNTTIARFYGTTPSILRSGQRHNAPRTEPAGTKPLQLRCRMPVRRPLNSEALFTHLSRSAVLDAEEGTSRWFGRVVRLTHDTGYVRFDSDGRGGIFATLIVSDPRDIASAYWRARTFIRADAEPDDPSGARIPGTFDPAETILREVVCQGLSDVEANQVQASLTHVLGTATPWGLLFPSASTLAAAGVDAVTGRLDHAAVVLRAAQALASGRIADHVGASRSALAHGLERVGGVAPRTIDRVLAQVLGLRGRVEPAEFG